eukprot:TRINITY_DN4975_c0_g1_i1.p1 TRINITY_DN4975_c0_g1~~TRINITY_DN4975_c0_g1_i1.p1  ORF type:complete len:209 (-),score=39.41 TRINITY_DN4975_c0_g1_i1:52-678(-)
MSSTTDTPQSLQELLNMGFIQQEEFNKRRAALNASSSIPIQDFKSIKQAASVVSSSSSGSPIYFNDPTGPYACFSNHYMTSIYIEGKQWPSTEHYFQAMKFTTPAYQDQIRMARTTDEAKQLGYAKRPDFRANWDTSRMSFMRSAQEAKFDLDQCKQVLISTGSAPLIYRSDTDDYWGDGSSRGGQNMLGKLLMEIREDLTDNSSYFN